VDPVISPGEGVPAVHHDPDQGAQRNLEHAEVQFGHPGAHDSHQKAQKPGENRRRHKSGPCPGARPGVFEGQGKGVGPGAVKHRVVKLVHAAKTQRQVQAHGEKAGGENKRQDIDVKPGREQRKNRQKNQRPGQRAVFFDPFYDLVYHPVHN
jgi:hypothetical protein